MGPDASKNARNAAIVIGLALVVWLLPGGRAGSATISNLLTVILLGALCFFGYRFYMERRTSLLDMENRRRAVLYGSLAAIAFAVVATGRLWSSGPGALVWLILVGAAAYGIVFVVRAEREY